MKNDIQSDVSVAAAPGMIKRLQKAMPLPIDQFLERNVQSVNPDTPIWQGVNLLVNNGDPIVVLEEGGQKFEGLIFQATAYAELDRLRDSED